MKKSSPFAWLAAICLLFSWLPSCGTNDDDDDSVGDDDDTETNDDAADDDAADDDNADDDDADDDNDTHLPQLDLQSIVPVEAGASVGAEVTLTGDGFTEGLLVFVGNQPAESVNVHTSTQATAFFPPIALAERGLKDVRVEQGEQSAILTSAFEYYFDEDPIVFVHGFVLNDGEWIVMMDRFRDLGYPDEALWAVSFSSSLQSSRVNARDELAPYIDGVLSATGVEKVDIVAHSMGGLSTRLWIKFYGGADKVRDYVSLSGTHHGTATSCLVTWLGDGAAETCPVYADEDESVNNVQWDLNGDPDLPDVDETPFGVEDGGEIYWNALRTDADMIDVPANTCCLNQSSRGDCSDPINVEVHGIGHIEMAFDPQVFELTRDLVRAHNINRP